jgi:hypothetical protein
MSGENMLLTFTNIGAGGGVFDQATQTTLDMATALGMDVPNAAMTLGKALNDPVDGMTKLTRQGVTFTDAQIATVSAMVKSGDTMGAQKVILQELQREFGGSAKAAGETFPGQLDIMKNKVDDVSETVGIALIPALSRVMEKISPIITGIGDWASKNPDLVLGIIGVAGGAFVLGGIFSVLGTVLSVGGTLLTGVGAFIGFLTGPLGLVVLLGALLAAAVVGYPGGLPKLLSDAADSFKKIVGIISIEFKNWIHDLGTEFHNLAIYLGLATDASGKWKAGGVTSSGGGDIQFGGGGTGGTSTSFHAIGGYVSAGERTVVGEQGPELFTPVSGGNITNARDTAAMMGGDTYNLTIYANDYAGGQAAARGFMDAARARGA